MDTNEYVWTDWDGNQTKDDWPPGPWHDEPDKKVWVDEATGLDCMIVRGGSGALCGYVGVPPEHPHYGKGYWYDEGGPDVSVHGGLTYASGCQGVVCHVPEEGRPHDVWWFGFDCSHAGDLMPGLMNSMKRAGIAISPLHEQDTYKDVEYVTNEVTRLAAQLKELA